MGAKPVVVFVPGGWHQPAHYEPVMQRLQAAGYETKGVHLPSVVGSEPLKTFQPDVDAIQAVLQPLVDDGREIVLFVHSYGGIIGSEAVRGFDKSSRERQGKPGGIIRLFFCCAFALPEGISFSDALQGKQLPWFRVVDDRVDINAEIAAEILYKDVDHFEPYAQLLKPHSYGTFFSKVTYARWKHVPSTYLFCEQDESIHIDTQREMVANSGVHFDTETVDASHSPFLSVPDRVTEAIRRAAGEKI